MSSSDKLKQIIDSARRLGVELDEAAAQVWLAAVSAAPSNDDDIVLDVKSGVFGHRLTMLDFSADDLAHFRKIGRLVEFHDVPGKVETALALSGSAAQSKIQTYPGDADFFERVNIFAPTREDACRILGDLMREKALSTLKGPGYELIEVKMGNYQSSATRDGKPVSASSPIAWNAEEVGRGVIELAEANGKPFTFTWEQAAQDPGWCKLDWVVADMVRKQVVNASNMLDATWESPDGTITPLDGYLDPYFQEVYLESESIPLFTKLAKQVDADALDHYVSQLEKETRKYIAKDPNFGKAAKRMYNVFRLTGRYEEAAFLRELFDEPATVLYQVWSLIRTIDDCFTPGSVIEIEHLLGQADQLILNVTKALEGEQEQEIVRELLQLRDVLSRERNQSHLSPKAEAARAELINLVNNFYYERMTAVPTIKAYMEGLGD
jgi:hypothetical protein